MANEFSNMSDQELLSFINSTQQRDTGQQNTLQKSSTPTTQQDDFSSMSDNDLMSFINQSQGSSTMSQQSSPFPSIEGDDMPSSQSKLSWVQEVKLSTLGNDKDLIMKNIRIMLPSSIVTLDESNEITIDGSRYNPEGFDLGDITRNASDILPLGGQVLGSIKGFMLGGAATAGVGAIPGGIVGGTIGALAGREIQLALGDFLGLDVDGRDYLEAAGNEIAIALPGEIAGAGLGVAGKFVGKGVGKLAKPLGNTKIARGTSNFVKQLFKKAKGMTPDTMQYIFQVPNEATEQVLNRAINNNQSIDQVLDPKFFDKNFSLKRISKMFFGKEVKEDVFTDYISNIGKQHSNALSDLANNIAQNSKDPYTMVLLKEMGIDLSDDTLGLIGRRGSTILSPENLDPNRSIQLADSILDFVEKNQKEISTALNSQRTKMINSAGAAKEVNVESLVTRLQKVHNDLTRSVTPDGKPVKLKGVDKLREILDTLTPKAKNAKPLYNAQGQLIKPSIPQPVTKLTLSQTDTLDRFVMDPIADEMFPNPNISNLLKGEFNDIIKGFRNTVDNELGIKGLNEQYSMFKDLITDAKFNRATARASLDSKIRNYAKQSQLEKNTLDSVLLSRNKLDGQKLKQQLSNYSAAQELLGVDRKLGKSVNSLQKIMEESNFLARQFDTTQEVMFKNISDFSSNPNISNIYWDTLNRQTAKVFDHGGANVFRAGSILNQLQLGSILSGAMAFGAIGAIGGVGLASQFSPKGAARILRWASKFGNIPNASKAITRRMTTHKNTAIERALLGRLLYADRNKNKK
jgi:hypothetical protein